MLSERLKVALPLSAVAIAAFFAPGIYGKIAFGCFSLLMLVGGIREIFELSAGEKRAGMLEWLSYLYGLLVLIFVGFFAETNTGIGQLSLASLEKIALIDWLILGALASFRKAPDHANVHLLLTGVFAVIVVNMLLFMPKIYFAGGVDGRYLLFFMVLVTKLSDVGAYFFGSMTAKRPQGNHKLAKLISPKKSWEGLLGGIVFGVIAAVIVYFCAGNHLTFGANAKILKLWEMIVLGILLPVMGLIGDLMESMLKRAVGAKDSGHVPGLGGVLDVLDSLIIAAPFFYSWLLLRGM